MVTNHTAAVRSSPHDQRVWEQWFRHVYTRVYYVLYRRTGGNNDVSDECAQGAIERFLKYQAIRKVTTDAEAVAYITRSAFGLWTDRRALDAKFEPLTEELPDDSGFQPSLDARLDLAQVTERLSPPDQALVQQLYAGHTVGEIADFLGISYTAAGVQIHRIKDRLRKKAGNM